MEHKIDESTISAWARLMRAQQALLAKVETDLKQHGLPPLRWYDVLLELNRSEPDGLRQYEIGAAVLLNKYNVSRLIDRLEKEKLLERLACHEDGRGAQVKITAKGRDLLKQMWPVYSAAISEHFSQHYSLTEIKQLNDLLEQLPSARQPIK